MLQPHPILSIPTQNNCGVIVLQKSFEESVKSAVAELSEKEKRQDALLSLQRECIRNCANAIKEIHAGKLSEAKSNVEAAEKIAGELKKNDSSLQNVSEQAYQEFVEAACMLAVAQGKALPSQKQLGVGTIAYLNGVADLVGELRRNLQVCLMKGDKKKAKELYALMEEVYEQLFTIKFSSSLVGGLRRKVDVARGQLESARSELLRS